MKGTLLSILNEKHTELTGILEKNQNKASDVLFEGFSISDYVKILEKSISDYDQKGFFERVYAGGIIRDTLSKNYEHQRVIVGENFSAPEVLAQLSGKYGDLDILIAYAEGANLEKHYIADAKNPDGWRLDDGLSSGQELIIYAKKINGSKSDPKKVIDKLAKKIGPEVPLPSYASTPEEEDALGGKYPAEGESNEYKFRIEDPLGLHARAAAVIVKACSEYDGKVEIIPHAGVREGEEGISAKGIMSVLTLGLIHENEFTISFYGGKDPSKIIACISEQEFAYETKEGAYFNLLS
ncbi:HPr family phosphocarrier protein [Nanoarchaeota archaeon]